MPRCLELDLPSVLFRHKVGERGGRLDVREDHGPFDILPENLPIALQLLCGLVNEVAVLASLLGDKFVASLSESNLVPKFGPHFLQDGLVVPQLRLEFVVARLDVAYRIQDLPYHEA